MPFKIDFSLQSLTTWPLATYLKGQGVDFCTFHGKRKFNAQYVISCCHLFSHQSLNRLKDLVAEHLDHLHYLNDILCLQIDNLNRVLTEHLVNRLFIPLYIYSLVKKFNTNSIEVIFILNRNVLPNLNFQAYCVQFHRLIFAKTLS